MPPRPPSPRLVCPLDLYLNRKRFDEKILFIGKCSENGPLVFGERGRVGDGVRLSLRSASLAPFFDRTGRRASKRMCKSSISPRMSARPRLLTTRSDLQLNIWGRNEIERNEKKNSIHIFKDGTSKSVLNGGGKRLDGGCGAPAASPSANCTSAHEDGEGRINTWADSFKFEHILKQNERGKKVFLLSFEIRWMRWQEVPEWRRRHVFLGLKLYFFLRNWWRRFTQIVTQSAVGIVAQQVRSNNGRRGEPQVGKLCGCNVLCAFSPCACASGVCIFNRVCSGAGSSGTSPGPPGTVWTLLLDGQGAAGCYGREIGRPGLGGGGVASGGQGRRGIVWADLFVENLVCSGAWGVQSARWAGAQGGAGSRNQRPRRLGVSHRESYRETHWICRALPERHRWTSATVTKQ